MGNPQSAGEIFGKVLLFTPFLGGGMVLAGIIFGKVNVLGILLIVIPLLIIGLMELFVRFYKPTEIIGILPSRNNDAFREMSEYVKNEYGGFPLKSFETFPEIEVFLNSEFMFMPVSELIVGLANVLNLNDCRIILKTHFCDSLFTYEMQNRWIKLLQSENVYDLLFCTSVKIAYSTFQLHALPFLQKENFISHDSKKALDQLFVIAVYAAVVECIEKRSSHVQL